MKKFIYLSLFVLSAGLCKAQSGFYGKRFSAAGAILLNKSGIILNPGPRYPTINLGLRYTMGGRGQLAIDYTSGKIDYFDYIAFNAPSFTQSNASIFDEVIFPIQKTSSIFIDQRIFRKNSYAPVGSYIGFGIGINKYSIEEGVIGGYNYGTLYEFSIEQPIETDFFINDYYITMGKVIPLGKRVLLDFHLRFNGLFLFNDVTYNISRNTTQTELKYDEAHSRFFIPDNQYSVLEENMKLFALRQRNIPRLLFSVQYLLF